MRGPYSTGRPQNVAERVGSSRLYEFPAFAGTHHVGMGVRVVVGAGEPASCRRARARAGAFGRRWPRAASVLAGLAFLAVGRPLTGSGGAPQPRRVAEMSLEELLALEVTTVSRKSEARLEAAAAVTVITREDIQRAGVTTLIEAVALAPGVAVSRINASQWALGIRGFQSRLSRSVLVLVDGRSVYTPLFAGVYWEAQDTLLEDVDRIEVIRGPGGTLWGANAVNGVINIITKRADETKGTLLVVGGGTEDRALVAGRYGGVLGGTSFRVYAKYADRDAQFHASGNDFDAWHGTQAGFRTDTPLGNDTLTVQGDAYVSRVGERASVNSFTAPYVTTVEDVGSLSGQNLLARYGRRRPDETQTTLQAYVDRTHHGEAQFEENRTTVDVDLQDRRLLPLQQEVTWGLGFRWSTSGTSSVPTLVIDPSRRTERLYSAFLQDEVSILPRRLRLTVGTKVEHNDYTGIEVQPSARLVFLPAQGQTLWAAVSRAVRTPSRVEFDVSKSNAVGPQTAVFARLTGDGGFVSEKVLAYEIGYRARIGARAELDLTAFYDDLDDLTSGELAGTPFAEGDGAARRIVIPFAFRNGLTGRSRGGEVAADLAPLAWLTVRASYSYLALDLEPKPESGDKVSGPSIEGASPRHAAALALHADLPIGLASDARLRFVDRLPAQGVKGYFDLSVRVSYRALPTLELSLVAQGLLRPRQLELAGGEAGNTEIQRAIHGRATWRF